MRKWPAQVDTVVVNVGRELSLLKMAINKANADDLLPTAGSGVPGVMLDLKFVFGRFYLDALAHNILFS